MGSNKNTLGSNDSNKLKKSKRKKTKDFWTKQTKLNGKVACVFDEALLSDYLKSCGYFNNSDFAEQQIVKLENNILYVKTKPEVFNDVLAYIVLKKDDNLRSCFIKQGEDMLIKRQGIVCSLGKLQMERYTDTRKEVRLFYKNTVVRVSKKGFKLETYTEFRKLNQYIYSEQIIQRKFDSNRGETSEFYEFLKLATKDKEHLKSVRTSIGYSIQSYKNPSLAKAVIITDIQSQVKNEAFGRSGKGIIIKALSHIIEVVEYNGKVTDLTTDKFVFQNVTVSTALIVLQDVTKSFQFESLFSTLTDNMSIERKHRSKISIPFSSSPKVALTTNYTIPQDTDSFTDRKHLITLTNFFNAKNKPEKHLNKLLFEWNEKEWASFDLFMIKCVMLFLKKGLVPYDSDDLKEQKIINLTSLQFYELMESNYNALNEYWSLKEIAKQIDMNTNDTMVRSKYTSKWIESYAAFKSYKVERRQHGGMTQISFVR